MKIEGEIKVNRFLRVVDLNPGEAFVFEDSNNIYMKTELDQFVNLEDGTVSNDYDDYQYMLVRRINAKIVVEG